MRCCYQKNLPKCRLCFKNKINRINKKLDFAIIIIIFNNNNSYYNDSGA